MDLESVVGEQQILLALDAALRATPARWWDAHKHTIQTWTRCKRLMTFRFGKISGYVAGQYSGMTNPREHILTCGYVWNELSRETWPHMFIYTLDVTPKNLYIQLELR